MKSLAWLSSLVSIAAGVYLLQTQAVANDSFLEIIAHGMGLYFIAKGLYLGPSLWQQAQQTEILSYLESHAAAAGEHPDSGGDTDEDAAQPSPPGARRAWPVRLLAAVAALTVAVVVLAIVDHYRRHEPSTFTDPNGSVCLSDNVASNGYCK
jgi:hypothetical protein